MKKFFLGLGCGMVLAAAGIILLFAAIRLSTSRPSVASNSVLMLRLEGEMPEAAPVEIPLPFFEEQSRATVRDVWSALKRAAEDSRIKAVVLAPRRTAAGWAQMQEIRESLVAFRRSGKPVYAFLRSPATRDYYLATAADRIWIGPEDFLDLKGLRVEAMYLRNTLNKLGVRMDVIHAGKYKDAYDMYTRDSMSPETREVLDQVLDLLYSDLVGTIASGRRKDQAAVRALIDQGPFIAGDALKGGLLDALGYEDQAFAELQARLKQPSLKRIDVREYLRQAPPEPARTRIALVVAEGTILQGGQQQGFGPTDQVRSAAFSRLLRRVKSDSTIRGVIVRVNSPGGDAVASDDILHEMKELSSAKPLVISMSDVAASGGYFMSVTGDPIVAYPNTITGSIGVITAKPSLRGLYEKLGISKELLTRGRFAALDSDYRPLDDAEKAKLSESVEATYRGFIDRVAAGRHRKNTEIAALAEGRVWLGSQAKDKGLVDRLGGLDAALDMLRQKARLAANEKVVLVPYPSRRSLLEVLLSRTDETAVTEMRVEELLARIPGGRWIRPVLEGGTLALMPYSVDIR